mmetsp:Transcript_49394/g.73641  ORF Transcript_49394/g.73641 Transcript_49394/m.73641 type:complete len:267 (-) Transcript_49394:16-816(-)|eukprot:CAMPEP_0194038670 /NCGR_PEP_ID=MMETSP0009_2-20130614/10891_1 /TAXON_ID=210454 /ORGANISM="Grammatophora oceanica, Strain CCMP 410" /LENGTH=266 /DNA_ID=CAMNT_0038681253 /DNA_START=9 /DNA_END=809 /DNA_ORIENTATION=+
MGKESTKQRRSARKKANTVTAGSNGTAESNLHTEIDKAEAAVVQARNATAQLHVWWKTHLFRMSLLVLALALNQSLRPTKLCISNIKAWNKEAESNPAALVTGVEAIHIIIKDALPEILDIILAVALTFFLLQISSNNDWIVSMANPKFMLSCMLCPVILLAYHQQRIMGAQCNKASEGDEDFGEVDARQFPIAIIYHTIVTGSVYFMSHQMRAREKDIFSVRDLRRKLDAAQKSGQIAKERAEMQKQEASKAESPTKSKEAKKAK